MKEKLMETIKKAYDSRSNLWQNSPFHLLDTLSPDEIGRWGENLLVELLQFLGYKLGLNKDIQWEPDQAIHDDGVYDFKFLGKRVEVKTSMRGVNNGWQHESLYAANDVWDKIIFVDVDLRNIYITIDDYINFLCLGQRTSHRILRKRGTLRENQTDKFKFDFSAQTIEYGLQGGITFNIDYDKFNESGLRTFLINKLTR